MNSLRIIFIIFFSFFLVQCDWLFKKNDPEPQLPPATQEGLNTFGCYVNGELWVPAGPMPAGQSRLSIHYDPTWRGGLLSIAADRNLSKSHREYFQIFMDSIPKYGESTYVFKCLREDTYTAGGAVIFSKASPSCVYYCNDDNASISGFLTLTKFDLPNQIFSGTFEFTLTMPDCDTMRVTDGRFDIKL